MKKNRMRSLCKYTAFAALAMLVVVMAGATFVEHFCGMSAALASVFHAPWFIALWVLTAVGGGMYLFGRRQKMHVRLLHAGLMVILAGAAISFFTSRSGVMYLREGTSTELYEDVERKGRVEHLPFAVTLRDFSVVRYEHSGRPRDYVSRLVLRDKDGAEREETVAMNRVLTHKGVRLYQHTFDEVGGLYTLGVRIDGWGMGVSYAGYLLFFAGLVLMLFVSLPVRGRRLPFALALCVVAAAFVGVARYVVYNPALEPLPPVLGTSSLLGIHVGFVMLGYTLLTLAFILALTALLCRRHLCRFTVWSRRLLLPALTFLGLGIFIGAVWAGESWGRYWGWDPKETWALITLILYALPAHRRSLPLFNRPRAYHIYIMCAFLALLMTYFGVNYYLAGLHSYG